MKPEFSWEKLSRFVTKLKESDENQKQQEDEKPQGPFAPIIQKWTSGDVLFSRGTLGTVFLDTDDAAEYRACVSALHLSMLGKHVQISRGAEEDAFKTAIMNSLIINNTDPDPEYYNRIEREMGKL